MEIVACLCALIALIASIGFLRTRRFLYDSISVAAIEVGLLMLAGALTAGAFAQHTSDGLWWNWNGPLTTGFTCGLLYCGYLILRHAVEEPTQRATFCAVFSIFAFVDIPIVAWSVDRWCSRHPKPGVSLGVPWYVAVGFLALAMAMGLARVKQEETRRERDARRRHEHELA